MFGARIHTTLLVDITSASVGAGYVSHKKDDAPVLVHSVRVARQGEGIPGVLRALDVALKRLQQEGGPKHHSLIGASGIAEAVVCVGAPLQESEIATKTVEAEKPFTFTKAMLEATLHEEGSRNLLIASSMNGYATHDPVGKRAKRADTLVLRSRIAPELYTTLKKTVRGFIGSDAVRIISFGEVAHSVLSRAFPREQDYLALRITDDASEAAYVRRGILHSIKTGDCGSRIFHEAARTGGASSLNSLSDGIIDRARNKQLSDRLASAQSDWISRMHECLQGLAAGGALPRSVYLFTQEGSALFISRIFESPELHALWLSDEPLLLKEMSGAMFDAFLHRTDAADDPFLDALALLGR